MTLRGSLGGVGVLMVVAGAVFCATVAPLAARATQLATARLGACAVTEPHRTRAVTSAAAEAARSALDRSRQPLHLRGQVVDERRRPVRGAVVFLDADPPQSAVSDSEGAFSFRGLPARRYSLSARAGDWTGGPVLHALSAAAAPVVIRVERGQTVAIEVVSAVGGGPIEGAAVAVVGGAPLSAMTARDGAAVIRGIPRGAHRIEVSAIGFATEIAPLRAPHNTWQRPARQRVVLRPAARLAAGARSESSAVLL